MKQQLLKEIEMFKDILCTKKLSLYCQERIVANIAEREEWVCMVEQLEIENI